MRVDIDPQWWKLANWYWAHGPGVGDGQVMSIWDMLEHDYGATKLYTNHPHKPGMWVDFPDEKSYTAFLLRWA